MTVNWGVASIGSEEEKRGVEPRISRIERIRSMETALARLIAADFRFVGLIEGLQTDGLIAFEKTWASSFGVGSTISGFTFLSKQEERGRILREE